MIHAYFCGDFNHIVLAIFLSFGSTLNAEVLLADDFSKDRLSDSRYYQRFQHDGFKVQGGQLIGSTSAWKNSYLSLIPMAGIEAQLSFKAKAGSEDYSIFSILADYRFLLDSLPLYFSVDLKRKRAWFWPGHGQVLEKKNLSINGGYNDIALIRSGNQFSLFVNDIKIYSVKQNARRGPASAKDSLNSATFALKIDQTELSNSVTFDKLLYTGKRGPEKKAVTEEFSLAGEKYLFTVIGDAHLDDWRKGQAKVSATFIQQAYRVYGVPPISRFMGMVQAKGVYYESGYGANNHGIIYTTAFADNVNSINHHELSHNWAHLYKQRWNTEGSANLPYAIHLEKSEKKLMLSNQISHLPENLLNGTRWADGFLLTNDKYFSLVNGMPSKHLWQGYYKASVFMYILYRSLGSQGFAKMHQVAQQRGVQLDAENMQTIVTELLGKEAKKIFSGFTVKGKGKYKASDSFRDSDQDGLPDLDEQIFGTSQEKADTDGDGYGDLGEISAGFSPLSKSEPGRGLILVDGSLFDWANRESIKDPNDKKLLLDIKESTFLIDNTNQRFLAAIKFHKPISGLPKEYSVSCTFEFDATGNQEYDYRVNLFLTLHRQNAFATNGYASRKRWDISKWTGLDGNSVKFITGKSTLEAEVPLNLIPLTEKSHVFFGCNTSEGFDSLDKITSIMSDQSQTLFPEKVWLPRR